MQDRGRLRREKGSWMFQGSIEGGDCRHTDNGRFARCGIASCLRSLGFHWPIQNDKRTRLLELFTRLALRSKTSPRADYLIIYHRRTPCTDNESGTAVSTFCCQRPSMVRGHLEAVIG